MADWQIFHAGRSAGLDDEQQSRQVQKKAFLKQIIVNYNNQFRDVLYFKRFLTPELRDRCTRTHTLLTMVGSPTKCVCCRINFGKF